MIYLKMDFTMNDDSVSLLIPTNQNMPKQGGTYTEEYGFKYSMIAVSAHIIYLTVMRREGGVKYLLDKLETISR
jgi:hypothetical protein